MANTQIATAQPKQTWVLFIIEMWERFGHYGMRPLLSLFLISNIVNMKKEDSALLFSVFIGLIYLVPVLGGWVADRFTGKVNAMMAGTAMATIGTFALSLYDVLTPKIAIGIGMIFIILGNGFFKAPCQALLGDLYGENDPRRDKGFNIFYMSVNVGGFFGPLLCGYLAHKYTWKYGFLAASIGIAICFFVTFFTRKQFPAFKRPAPQTALANKAPAAPLTAVEKDRIKAIIAFAFLAIFFWAFFEQGSTSLTFFAEEATRKSFLGLNFAAAQLQSINPLFVVMLVPVFNILWDKLGPRNPSIPVKFGLGLILLGLGFGFMVLGAHFFETSGPVSVMWLVGLYLFTTSGELCLSPVGNAMVTKLSPAKYVSMLMGVWFASIFAGNLLGGVFASSYDKLDLRTLFAIPAVSSIFFAGIVFLSSKKINGWMHGVK